MDIATYPTSLNAIEEVFIASVEIKERVINKQFFWIDSHD